MDFTINVIEILNQVKDDTISNSGKLSLTVLIVFQ
jgi:hypothetical protein